MEKRWIILGVILIIVIIGLAILPKTIDRLMQGGPGITQRGPSCSVQPGEWIPERGECPGTSAEMQAKCTDFCNQHPDCCQGGGREEGRSNVIPLPNPEEISKLSRNYPSTIKAINEGPAIYGQEQFKVLSDETLSKMKEAGFNTLQVLTINDCTGDECVMDEASKSLLLNDIVKAKEAGLAVWLAVEYINAPPGSNVKLPEYAKFRNSFIDYCKEIGELAEQYQIEYVTVNNEPDLFLQEQTQWGSKEQIDEHIIEIMPLANSAVKEKFKGKVINKITQPRKRTIEVLDASFENADIAGVDVGPPVSDTTDLEIYKKEFDDYQYYASLAEKAGVQWMNAEYWQYMYFAEVDSYVKENQVILAEVSFNAYLETLPKGAGYTWNDFSSLSLPKGEETQQALKDFLNKI